MPSQNLNIRVSEKTVINTANGPTPINVRFGGDVMRVSPSTIYVGGGLNGENVVSILAGVDIGGHRVVVQTEIGLGYADNTNPAHAGMIVGITTAAVTAGSNASVALSGKVENSGWSWDITKGLWLSTNGLITQTEPATGFILSLGVPISSTAIDFKKGISMIRS